MLPPGLHNFSNKIGSGEALLCGMQIFASLSIYMQDMRLKFLSICKAMIHGRPMVIGSPAFQLSPSSNPSPKMGGAWIPENQMKLRPDQVQVLFEFLAAQESLLKHISSYDKKMRNKPSARSISLSLPMAEEFGKERKVAS